jgi:hypothetical protein
VVERAWESFVAGELGQFNKTVFHYLLRRLADLGSGAAVGWALSCAIDRPEETEYVLRYLGDVGAAVPGEALDQLAGLLSSEAVVYDYQRYLVLRWFYERGIRNDTVLDFARRRIGGSAPPLLRPHAIAYVGDHGDNQDFPLLERVLQEEIDSLGRATILIALRREPGPIRNHWYGRCAGESPVVDRALLLARRGSSPA